MTDFIPLEVGNVASLLMAQPRTGRTHQIRVHAADLHAPLAGDEKYGDRAFNRLMRSYGLKRLFPACRVDCSPVRRRVDGVRGAARPGACDGARIPRSRQWSYTTMSDSTSVSGPRSSSSTRMVWWSATDSKMCTVLTRDLRLWLCVR